MTPSRRRRVTVLPKKTMPPPKKRIRRPRQAAEIDWKSELIKLFIVLFVAADLVLVYFVVRQCSSPHVIEEKVVEEEPRILQVEVLNGCGVDGAAIVFTNYLRSEGFDVVKTDNYESFNVLQTVVIDRRGNLENGVKIARSLGLGEDRVLQEVNEAYLIDATIIIGKDFRQLSAWSKMER